MLYGACCCIFFHFLKRFFILIWHPYTQMQTAPHPIQISYGKGAVLYTTEGKELIDAVSSWWVNLHGHAHPYMAQRIYEQAQQLEQVIFAGFTHQPAQTLAARLLGHLPQNQTKVFFSDDGSTAVEVALKMALQYWHNKHTPRTRIVAFKNAYHGDTFGAMSVSGRSTFTEPFTPMLFDVTHIAVPTKGNEALALEQLEQCLQSNEVAAFIFEPLVQGTAGMVMYQPETLDAMLALCKKHQVITIADEVMTGFGRTGRLFASHYLQQQPDVFCLSKGLTGGYLPMGITTCAQFIYDAFLSDDRRRALFHGHSYTANSLACAAALASLDLLEDPFTQKQIQHINQQHQQFKTRIAQHPKLADCRITGTIMAIEIATTEQSSYFNHLRDFMYNFCIEQGVLLRPLGNIVYIIPPYCINPQQLERVYEVILLMIEEV